MTEVKPKTLQERCMLVSLQISQWTGRKLDKKAGQAIAEKYGTEANIGNYHKVLLGQKHLKEIQQMINALRVFHYENTVPWNNNGQDVLTLKNYLPYTSTVKRMVGLIESKIEEFIVVYPDLKKDDEKVLNGLYNEADYPSVKDLRKKFKFKVEFTPIPASGHLMINLDEDHLRAIQEDIDTMCQERTKLAMSDLWKRLYKVVAHMQERLQDSDQVDKDGYVKPKIFRDTLVSNIEEVCDLLPRLNVDEDPNLDAMAAEVKKGLAEYDPESLREDDGVRFEARTKAEQILKKMQEFMA